MLITRLHIDVNQPGKTGWNALHFASQGCFERMIRLLLLKYNANPNAVTNEQWTPLHILVRFGIIAPDSLRESLLRLFIEKGANLFARTDRGWTALHLAVKAGDELVVRLLLQHFAEKGKHVCKALEGNEEDSLKNDLVNVKNSKGWSPLCISLQQKNTSITRMLVENGANVEYLHPSRKQPVSRIRRSSPLRVAVQKGGYELVALLIDGGVDVNRQDPKGGMTALHAAVKSGFTPILSLLLKNGANPHLRVKGEWTPLHLAARFNNTEALRALLVHGGDPTTTTSNGNTALSVAVQNKAIECVEFLLSQGVGQHSLPIPLAKTLWRPLHAIGTLFCSFVL